MACESPIRGAMTAFEQPNNWLPIPNGSPIVPTTIDAGMPDGAMMLDARIIDAGVDALPPDAFIPPDAAPDALAALLADPLVVKRRRALEVIAARGQECAPLLPALAAMLETAQPTQHVSEWIDEHRSRSRQVDRSDLVQRLAADAILAVAPTDHALVAVARARLGKPAAE